METTSPESLMNRSLQNYKAPCESEFRRIANHDAWAWYIQNNLAAAQCFDETLAYFYFKYSTHRSQVTMPMLTISPFIKYCFRMEAASQTFHYFADCPGDINHKIVISYPQFVVKALSFFVLLSFFCLFLFFDFIQCIIYKPYKSKVHLDKFSATGFFCNETFTLPRLSV